MNTPTVFNSLDPSNTQRRKHCKTITNAFAKSPSKGNLKKVRDLFAQCEQDVFIEAGFHCDYGAHISIGKRTFSNINCTVVDAPINEGKISIGDDCLIGPNVQILAVGHATDPVQRLNKHNLCYPVMIGDNVWIGAGAIILPGVIIGDNSVVAAGAVVTKSVMQGTLVAGNPAVQKKSFT